MPDPLYLVRMQIERGALYALGKLREVPMKTPDDGYLVNTVLRETWSSSVPRPFFIEDKPLDARRPRLSVLAYASKSEQELRALAEAASEKIRTCLVSLESKPIAARFAKGQCLRFQVRVCPLVRVRTEDGKGRGEREVDAFLARGTEVGEGVSLDRETVYRDWLGREFARRGGAEPMAPSGELAIQLGTFRLGKQFRRDQTGEKRGHILTQPEATLRGLLQVTDGEAFEGLLRRGIGRQLHFGFGMLLLSRPGPDA